MDKLIEHGIRMLEIVEGENDFYRNDAKRQADIARAVYDIILRVQTLERKADRKTEPTTEDCSMVPTSSKMEQVEDEPKTQMKTQNSNLTFEKADERCKGCNHYKLTCDLFSEICRYEPKDEPTISKMEQVDKDINVRSKDEPQTEPLQTCSVNGRPYDCGKCEYHKCTADEPQTERSE